MCVKIRRNVGRRDGEAVVGGNKAPPQAPAAGVCNKCGHLLGGECMVGYNACYVC